MSPSRLVGTGEPTFARRQKSDIDQRHVFQVNNQFELWQEVQTPPQIIPNRVPNDWEEKMLNFRVADTEYDHGWILLASCHEQFPGDQLDVPRAVREFRIAALASANEYGSGLVDSIE